LQNSWKTPLLIFFVLACGAKPTLAQDAGNAQQEAIRKLETKMDELRSQMAEIESQLEAIRGGKIPATGSIQSKPPAPQLKLSPEQTEAAAGEATSAHETFAHDEEDAPRLYNAPLGIAVNRQNCVSETSQQQTYTCFAFLREAERESCSANGRGDKNSQGGALVSLPTLRAQVEAGGLVPRSEFRIDGPKPDGKRFFANNRRGNPGCDGCPLRFSLKS